MLRHLACTELASVLQLLHNSPLLDPRLLCYKFPHVFCPHTMISNTANKARYLTAHIHSPLHNRKHTRTADLYYCVKVADCCSCETRQAWCSQVPKTHTKTFFQHYSLHGCAIVYTDTLWSVNALMAVLQCNWLTCSIV